jgi:hypothetical protein
VLCLWKKLFRADHNGQHGHGCDIHDAQRKEQHKEQPVRSQAREAVRKAQAKGTSIPVMPSFQKELLRPTVFRQAGAFERRELVESGQDRGCRRQSEPRSA